MKVTPLEIRQKTFERHFRGYDKDEVNAFLLSLSQEWERTVDENKALRIKLDSTEKEILKLREVENSLYKTLKTAEDTGANVIEQARQAAELNMRESQFKAEAILTEAKAKARDMIEESDMRSKEILADMEERFKNLVENYKKLETTRDDLISELKRLATDTLDRVERARNNAIVFDADQHLNQVRRETKKAIFPNHEFKAAVNSYVNKDEPSHAPEKKEVVQQTLATEPQTRKVQKSFFDEIG